MSDILLESAKTPLQTPWILWEITKHVDGKQYHASVQPLCEFTTLEEFWSYSIHTPPPSVLFSDGANKHQVVRKPIIFTPKTSIGQSVTEQRDLYLNAGKMNESNTCVDAHGFENVHVEGLALFRSGIVPVWEAPENSSGGEWSFRKPLGPHILDNLWETLCLGVLTETIEHHSIYDTSLELSNVSFEPVLSDSGAPLRAGNNICGIRVVDKCTKGRTAYRLELWYRDQSETETIQILRQNMIAALSNRVGKSNIPRFAMRSHQGALEMEQEKQHKTCTE